MKTTIISAVVSLFLCLSLFADEMSVTIQPWDNPDMPRKAYLRAESLPLKFMLSNPKEKGKSTLLFVFREGDQELLKKKINVPVLEENEYVSSESFPLGKFRRGVYTVEARWICGTNAAKTNVSVRICGDPYDGGLPVGMWWESAYKKKGLDEITSSYREKGLNTLQSMAIYAELLDECLWQGLYCASITHGNAVDENGKRIETGLRKQASGEPYVLGKNARWSIANTNWQAAMAKSIGVQVGEFLLHPAYLPYVNTSDDYFHWTGLDYNGENMRRFKLLTGRDAPRPPEVLTNAFPIHINRVKGIIPDDDVWVQWMRFLCRDVLGNYNRLISESVSKHTNGRGHIGPVSGGGLEDVMGFSPYVDILSGQWPPFNFGKNGFSLLCCYNYNFYKYPALTQMWWYELGKMGNRDLPQWLMPETMDRRKAVHLQNLYLYLAANQNGIMYFIHEQTTAGAWSALQELVPLHKRFGLLLAEMKPAESRAAMLMPFEQACFRTQYPVDAQYAFCNLLMANADVVPVIPEEIEPPGSLKVLFLHDIDWITAGTEKRIKDFIKKGGTVLSDSLAEVEIEGVKKIDFALGVADRAAGYGNVETIEKIRGILPSEGKSFVSADDPHWIFRHYRAGGADYVWVVNLMTHKEDADHIPVQGVARKVETLPQYAGIETGVRTVVLNIATGNVHVVDVIRRKVLDAVVTNGVMRVKIQANTWQGALLAFYPDLPAKMQIKSPRKAEAGSEHVADIKIYGGRLPSKQVDFAPPLTVKVYNPDGRENMEYSRRVLAENGAYKLKMPFAVNDEPGTYRIEITEEITGLNGTSEVLLY